MAKTTLPEKYKGLQKLLAESREAIEQVIPKHLTAERMMRIGLTALRTTPGLMDCTPASFVAAMIEAAGLGLEPDSSLGNAHLIPYGRECKLVIGYPGYLELIFRAEQVEPSPPVLVYEADEFEWDRGTNAFIRHIPNLEVEDRGKLIAGYMTWRWAKTGHESFHVISAEKINKVREFALSKIPKEKQEYTPWVVWRPDMEMKTVVIQAIKFIPRSPEMARAVYLDNMAAMGKPQVLHATLEEGYIDIPSEAVKQATQERTEELREKLGAVPPEELATGEPEETPELATDAQRGKLEELLRTSTLNKPAQEETRTMVKEDPSYEMAQGLIDYLKDNQTEEKQEGLPV